MLRLFKRSIPINAPDAPTQDVVEIESHTVTWGIKSGWSNSCEYRSKVFVNIKDANAFAEQLQKSADFIKAYIEIKVYKND